MSDLVVGNEGCSYNAILKQLTKCETLTKVRDDWRLIATHLDLPIQDQNNIEARNQGSAPFNYMQDILVTWRSKSANGATLGVFISTLKELNYNDMANQLEVFFNIKSEALAAGTSGVNSPGDGRTDVEKKQNHILENLEDLITYLRFDATLSANMLSKKILSRQDIVNLESITNPTNRNKEFLMLIHDKLPGHPGIYDKLVDALEKGIQTGVLTILKRVS